MIKKVDVGEISLRRGLSTGDTLADWRIGSEPM